VIGKQLAQGGSPAVDYEVQFPMFKVMQRAEGDQQFLGEAINPFPQAGLPGGNPVEEVACIDKNDLFHGNWNRLEVN